MDSPATLKSRFAKNFDVLLRCAQLNRKEAAAELDIPYKVIRRWVSAGISRTDHRNIEALERTANYFLLNHIDQLWSDNLLLRLLTTRQGRPFVEKFKVSLAQYKLSLARATGNVCPEDIALIGKAVSENYDDDTNLSLQLKVKAILDSDKREQFQNLISDYYELIHG